MKYNVIRSPRARQQLLDIMVYLEKAEPGLGLEFFRSAQEVEMYLRNFPEMRPAFEHTNPRLGDIRMIHAKKFKHYTFFYQVRKLPENIIDIITILHDEQNIESRIDSF